MGETGKRHHWAHGNDGRDEKKRAHRDNNNSSGNNELVVYRILCPDRVIGIVIGKSGKVINSIRQETQAKVKVVDAFPGANKRVITIYCYVKNKDPMDVDEDDVRPACPAQDALIKVHDAIVSALTAAGEGENRNKVEANILVPASQAANVIGKSGSTIKRLRNKTGTSIKVTPKDLNEVTHSCAMNFDNFVQITGEPEAVKRALTSISAILYKFSPKEEISLDTSIPDIQPSIIIPSDLPIYPSGSFFHHTDTVVPSSRTLPPVLAATTELHGFADASNSWPVIQSALPVVSGYGGASRSEEMVIRVLCPSDKIGRVIGKGGCVIKSIRQSSGAQIDVDDTKDENGECVITITCTESTDDHKSAISEAVLLLQEKINDEDEDRVNIRLLVPLKSIGSLIGKGGSIINEIRKKSRALIRISKGEKPESFASSDELVEVSGEVQNLRDALVQIMFRLREDALSNRESSKTVQEGTQTIHSVNSIYSSNLPIPPVLSKIQPIGRFGYDQRVDTEHGLTALSGSSLYGYNTLSVGDNSYEPLSSYSAKSYGGLPSHTEMVIPASAMAKVVGKGGTNIDNIRKISGARVEIVDSKTSRFERIAQISGTAEQKRSAENLIQAFILST